MKEIIPRYLAGETLKEIASDIGTSGEFVRRYLKKNGVDRRGKTTCRKKKLSTQNKEEIIALYRANASPPEICKLFKIGETLFYSTLREFNIPSNQFYLETYVDIPSLCKDYQNGFSSGKLSKKYSTSKSSVTAILRRNDISVRDSDLASKTYFPDRTFFKKIDAPEKAYIFGILLADGCNHRNTKFSLTLHTQDRYLLDNILGHIFPTTPPPIYDVKDRQCSHITISDRVISEDLIKKGMAHAKSLILHYPLRKFNQNLFGHFLRGFFDGDGCIYFNEKSKAKAFIITGGSLDFLNGLREAIIKAIGYNIPKVYFNARGWYDIRTSRKQALLDIFNLMYPPDGVGDLYMVRKFNKFKKVVEIC